jgi:hypothetical protein
MVWRECSSHLTVLTFALSLGLATNLPTQVLAQSNSSSTSAHLEKAFEPPRTEKSLPANTEGGATRGGGSDEPADEPSSDTAAPVPVGRSPEKLSSDERSSNKIAPVPVERSPEKRSSDEQH